MEIRKKDNLGGQVKEQHYRNAFLGSINIHKGQKMFELDLKTGEIRLSEYRESTMTLESLNKTGGIRKKLVLKPNHLYAPAINLVTAKKKFNNQIKAKNEKNSGRKIQCRCPKCETDGSISISINRTDKGVVAHISKCMKCEYQSQSLSDFLPTEFLSK